MSVTVRYETFDTIYTGTKGFTILPAPPQRQPMGITAPGRVPGGTIEIDPKNATPGQTVTITVKPDKGYEIGDVTDRRFRISSAPSRAARAAWT